MMQAKITFTCKFIGTGDGTMTVSHIVKAIDMPTCRLEAWKAFFEDNKSRNLFKSISCITITGEDFKE